jgi:hypothetical protein
MTDMSFPALDEADEFGWLDHLVPPGQDPELVHRLYAAFTAALQPEDFIQRLWARDMAIETARVEYLRQVDCAVHRFVEERQPPAEEDRDEAENAKPRSSNALGRAYAAHFPLFDGITRLELHVLKERDEIISRYDNRGKLAKMLEDALARIEELEERLNG